jgi:hypothetical protein
MLIGRSFVSHAIHAGVCDHAHSRDRQQRRKHIFNPVKPLQQPNARSDERSAHHHCSGHAPEQYLRLSCLRYLEQPEKQHEHKKVVDRQGLLQHIPRKKLRRPHRVIRLHQQRGKPQRRANPKTNRPECLPSRVPHALRHPPFSAQQHQQGSMKADPV